MIMKHVTQCRETEGEREIDRKRQKQRERDRCKQTKYGNTVYPALTSFSHYRQLRPPLQPPHELHPGFQLLRVRLQLLRFQLL